MISTSIIISDIVIAASSIVVVVLLAADGRPGVTAALIGGRCALTAKPPDLVQKIGRVQITAMIGRILRPRHPPFALAFKALALPARARVRSETANPIL